MDERWRVAVRRSRSEPGDQSLIEQAIAACKRAGAPIPSDLFDRRLRRARTFECDLAFEVTAELLSGRLVELGSTPGTVEIPDCRTWWVKPKPVVLTSEGAVALREQEVPGLSLMRSKKTLDDSLPHLASLGGLSFLSLQSCGVTDDQLAALPDIPHLSTLDLSGARLTGAGMRTLCRFPNLVRLYLDSSQRIKDLDPLAELPRLQRLSLDSALLSDRELAVVAQLDLTHLDVEWLRMGKNGFEHIAGMSSLRQLIIGPPRRVSEAAVRGMSRLQNLRTLIVRTPFAAGFEQVAAELPELRWLGVLGPDRVDTGVIAGMTDLRRLELRRVELDDLRDLARMTWLERLSLRYSLGTIHWWEHLEALEGLTVLELSNCLATHVDRLFHHLRQLPRLRRLVLSADLRELGDLQRATAASDLPGVEVSIHDYDTDRRKPTVTSQRAWSRWCEWQD